MDTEGVLLRFDGLFRRVQEEMEEDKETIETVNILMVVAAFIAGVQAQIISFTLNLPLSALPRAANLFAFVGLMLEIIGTFLGAVHSVFLQRKVKGFNRTVNNMIQCKVDLKITMKLYIDALENEEKRKADEQREKKASNDHDPGENGLSGQENVEDPSVQEPEEISTSQNPNEDIPSPRQLQVEKYDTHYYPVGPASTMFSGARVQISGGTFVTNTNNNVNSFLGRSIEEDIDDQKERLERLQSTMQEIRSLNNSQLGVIGLIENILEKAREILKLDVIGVQNSSDSAQDSSSQPPTGRLARAPTQPFNVSALSPGPYNAEATPPIFKLGNIPVLSMASGVVCLAISTILLSAANKGLGMEVWITSTLVLAMVAVLSVFPFRSWVFDQIKIHWTDMAGRRQTMPK